MPKMSNNLPLTAAAEQRQPGTGLRLLLAVELVTLSAGLGYTVLSLPGESTGLRNEVVSQLVNSGVSHPVTAVLLNFRGYDTLLEMAVLSLALIGVWSLAPAPSSSILPPGAVLERVVQLYTPLMLLTAGYLLWNGAHASGGAFQAGAVLAAAAVLMNLSGRHLPAGLSGWPLRLALILGLGVFTMVAAFLAWRQGALLHYPRASAGLFILLIETAATISISATLAALFLGGRPGYSR